MQRQRGHCIESKGPSEVIQVNLLLGKEEPVGEVTSQGLAVPLLEFVLAPLTHVIPNLLGDGADSGLRDQAFAG